MTTSSNDDGRDELDDPALRSMRAMWISMRDEEPPAAGLAELLAAARVKAEEMRPREPWWRRIAVALRRPPVLALATAVVLLGGAVVIGARREAFDAMPRIEGQPAGGGEAAAAKLEQAMAPAEDTAAGSAAPAPAEVAAATAGVSEDEPTAAPAVVAAATAGVSEDEPTAAPGGGATRPAPRPAFRAAAPRRGSAPPAAPAPEVAAPVAGTVTADRTVAADPPPITRERVEAEAAAAPVAAPAVVAPPAPPPPAAPPPPSVPRDVKGPKQRLQIADDGGRAGEAQLDGTGAAPDRPSAGGEQIEATGSPKGPTVGQLAKQAETAAARGDCAAVRAIATRLRKLDAAAHRSLAERNAAVARCLK